MGKVSKQEKVNLRETKKRRGEGIKEKGEVRLGN